MQTDRQLPSTPPNAQDANGRRASANEDEAAKSHDADLHGAEQPAAPRLHHGRVPHLQHLEPGQVVAQIGFSF